MGRRWKGVEREKGKEGERKGRRDRGKEGRTGREGENVKFYPNFIHLNF